MAPSFTRGGSRYKGVVVGSTDLEVFTWSSWTLTSGEGASAVAGDRFGWVTTGQGEWGISVGITVTVLLSLWNSRSSSSFHAV